MKNSPFITPPSPSENAEFRIYKAQTWPEVNNLFIFFKNRKRNEYLTSKVNADISSCVFPLAKQLFFPLFFLFISPILHVFESRCKLHLREALCILGPECNEWLNQSLHEEGCRRQTISGANAGDQAGEVHPHWYQNLNQIKQSAVTQGAAETGTNMQSHARRVQ